MMKIVSDYELRDDSMQNISSNEKMLIILKVLGTSPYQYRIREICEKTGFNRTTVYRNLALLEEYGLIGKDQKSDQYRVGHQMYHIGETYLRKYPHRREIEEILDRISMKTEVSVGIAVKDGDHIISVFGTEAHQPTKFNYFTGNYHQPNAGSYGKCIMAFQSEEYIDWYLKNHQFEKTSPFVLTEPEELKKEFAEIRKQGYAVSINEKGLDVWGVAVPIYNREGIVQASIAVAYYNEPQDGMKRLLSIKDTLLASQEQLGQYLF